MVEPWRSSPSWSAVVPEPAVVPVPDPEPETVREPEPVVQVPAVPPALGARGRSSVSPLRRRSRFWHVLVLLATAVLFAGVVAVGVVVVSELTDRDGGSGVTASAILRPPPRPRPGTSRSRAPRPRRRRAAPERPSRGGSRGRRSPGRSRTASSSSGVTSRCCARRPRTRCTSCRRRGSTRVARNALPPARTGGTSGPCSRRGLRRRRSSRHVSTFPSRRRTPGRALRRRTGSPGWCRRRLLGSGGAAAPGREFLALLPSGPDAVRTLPVRGTRPSTPRVDDPCP